MNIVVVGNDISFAECRTKFGDCHAYHHFENPLLVFQNQNQPEVLFDFNSDWTAERLAQYGHIGGTPIFLNTVFTAFSNLPSNGNIGLPIYGFCGLPTFFNRSILEVTTANPANAETLNRTMGLLKTEFKIVKDQVGMVSPRVVCMIINEAYEALKQGVASREDIDLSMKLGTNYPYGPFEWGERIGLENVRRLLNALEESSSEVMYHPNF